MNQRRTMILALLLSGLAGLVVGDEPAWNQFRGPKNGHSQAAVPLTWSEQDNVAWKTPIHDRGWSSPVIWQQQIWLTTASEDGKRLYAVCVDLKTGKVLHDVKLFDVAEPRFCHSMNSYASPTPVVEQGRVYVHFGSYGTACLDSKTAEVLWSRRDLPCDHFRGPGSSPLVHGEKLIIHFDGFDYQYVVALDKATGKTLWKVDRDIEYGTNNGDVFKAYCTPLVIQVKGRSQLISPTSKATLAYDPETGKELWRVRYTGFSATARPLFQGGLLFINSGFSKANLLAVRPDGSGDVTDSHVVWTVKKSIGSKPSQLLLDDLIYNVSDSGVASCLEAATGKEVWTQRLGGKYSSSLLSAGGRIYFFSHEGVTTVVAPGRVYKELASNRLDDGFMASPAVAGDALILRTRTHLYRIEDRSGN